MDPNWYKTFFTPRTVDFWRRAVPESLTEAECGLISRSLALEPGARVLDAPCGHGRHAIALAASGHRVTGVDVSPAALARARTEARARGVEVDWLLGDKF